MVHFYKHDVVSAQPVFQYMQMPTSKVEVMDEVVESGKLISLPARSFLARLRVNVKPKINVASSTRDSTSAQVALVTMSLYLEGRCSAKRQRFSRTQSPCTLFRELARHSHIMPTRL